MKTARKQQGFTIVEVVVVLVVIAVLVVGGWWVYSRNNDDSQAETTSTTSTEVATEKEVDDEVPEPKNASDLKKLGTQLSEASLGDEELSDLDSQLDF